MSRFMNLSQLQRRCDVARVTLERRIAAGTLTPDGMDTAGRLLFLESRVPEIREQVTRRKAVIL
jgi:predicted site-specific integrase-resolvase